MFLQNTNSSQLAHRLYGCVLIENILRLLMLLFCVLETSNDKKYIIFKYTFLFGAAIERELEPR